MALITKKEFEDIIKMSMDYENEMRNLPEIINFNCPIFEYYWKLFNNIFDNYFDKEGNDWINWWLWDKKFSPIKNDNKAWDKNGKEIPTETIDDLWDLVKEYRK